jgi:nucleoside-diphosphate-sugar epimerase
VNSHETSVKSCLVIGGRGFVGSAVAAEAGRRGYAVTVVEKDDYESHVGRSADILINANGNSKKFLARENPSLDFDLSARSVARTLHDFCCRLYVHLSSIDVYHDVSHPDANHEDIVIQPEKLSPYGFHKYLAEQLVRFYAPSWLIFRMGGFVGPRLWKNPIYDLLKGQPLRVHPDSRYQYLHTRSLAEIVLDILESDARNEIFNVVGDGTVSLREVAAWHPGARLPPALEQLPREHYEVNARKIKQRVVLPQTVETVRTFIQNVLAGQETIA